jgi:hypothetical protein
LHLPPRSDASPLDERLGRSAVPGRSSRHPAATAPVLCRTPARWARGRPGFPDAPASTGSSTGTRHPATTAPVQHDPQGSKLVSGRRHGSSCDYRPGRTVGDALRARGKRGSESAQSTWACAKIGKGRMAIPDAGTRHPATTAPVPRDPQGSKLVSGRRHVSSCDYHPGPRVCGVGGWG